MSATCFIIQGAVDRGEHSQAFGVVIAGQQQWTEREAICCNDGRLRAYSFMLSTPMAQNAFSDVHKEDVKQLMGVNNIDPNGVQIIVAIGDGSQLVLEMDSTALLSICATDFL